MEGAATCLSCITQNPVQQIQVGIFEKKSKQELVVPIDDGWLLGGKQPDQELSWLKLKIQWTFNFHLQVVDAASRHEPHQEIKPDTQHLDSSQIKTNQQGSCAGLSAAGNFTWLT